MTAPSRVRVQRRPVHGVLLLDKPLNLSSNQALQKARWLLRAEKAGHTGTLDPLASGVLPLCMGAATKFSQSQLEADKQYEAIIRLGIQTSTGDAEGEIIATHPADVDAARVEAVRQQFLGEIEQVPPMHSALKKDGKALYEYARAGVEVERVARRIRIHALELTLLQDDGAPSRLHARVHCSKGTYIRTLGEDIGKALGCGAHLGMLRRTATGPFDVAQAITLEQLEAMPEAQRLEQLLPVHSLLPDSLQVELADEDAGRFLSGMRRRGNWPDAQQVAVFGLKPKVLLGSAHIHAGELIPARLLNPAEVRQILQQEHEAAPASS